MEPLRFSGRVVSGLGQGASFTQLAWARDQFITKLGIDPYPGTFNVRLDSPAELAKWTNLKTRPGSPVTAPDPAWCDARCYPVRIGAWLPGAIVYPEVPGYPETQVELIAALPLREKLSLADGDVISLEVSYPLNIQAVLFDVDGTLVDSVEAYRVVAERAVAPYNIPITRQMVRHALDINHPNFWDMVVPANQSNRVEMIKEMKKAAIRHWGEVLRQHGRVFSGLRETLDILRARKIRLGIVTGSHGGSLQPLREAGLMDFFEVVVTGKEVERRKPDPQGLLKGATVLGVEPGETVYVGDASVDIRASRAAGMAAVAVLSGAGDPASLSAEGPDWLIHSHTRLPEIIT